MQYETHAYYNVLNPAPDYITDGVITDKGTMIDFSNLDKIYRSTDNVAFNLVNTANIDPIVPPLPTAIDNNGDTIVFGEYDLSDGPCRLIRSTDDGATWNVVLSLYSSTDIRHWHTVNYDPYNGNWYATSGDYGTNIRWYVSTDNGATFTQMPNVGNDQKYRTTQMLFTPDGQVWWGSDTPESPGVYHAPISDPTNCTKVYTAPHVIRGLVRTPSGVFIGVDCDEGDGVDDYATIFTSADGGQTWQTELSWLGDRANNLQTGFKDIYGPDNNGCYYVTVCGCYQNPMTILGLELIPKSSGITLDHSPWFTVSSNALFTYGTVADPLIASRFDMTYLDLGTILAKGVITTSIPGPSPTPTPTPTATPSPTPTPSPTSTPSPTPTPTPTPAPGQPVAGFTISPQSGQHPIDVYVTDTSTGATWYQYNFGDNTPNSTTANPVHTYPNPKTYTITQTVGNADGTATTTTQIVVS